MNPHTYGHLIFDEGTKTIQWGGGRGIKSAFSTNSAGTAGGYHAEECKLIHNYLLVLRSSLRGSRTST
jgi:hypothetical protein